MKKRILLPIFAAGGISLIAATTAFAMPGGDGYACHHGMHGMKAGMSQKMFGSERGLQRMSEKLQLSPEQQASIKAIYQKNYDSMRATRQAIRENRQKILELTSTDFDEMQLRELAEQQGKLRADLIVASSHSEAAVRALLLPEQLQQWQEMRGKYMQKKMRKMVPKEY